MYVLVEWHLLIKLFHTCFSFLSPLALLLLLAHSPPQEFLFYPPGFRMVRPVKSRRHDQTVSLSWCPWPDLANKYSQGLVGISPKLVSLFPPARMEGREGVLISMLRCMQHHSIIEVKGLITYLTGTASQKHTVIWNSPWVGSLNLSSESTL